MINIFQIVFNWLIGFGEAVKPNFIYTLFHRSTLYSAYYYNGILDDMLIFHSFYVADTRIPAIPVSQDSRSIVPQNIVMLPELKKIEFKEKREKEAT